MIIKKTLEAVVCPDKWCFYNSGEEHLRVESELILDLNMKKLIRKIVSFNPRCRHVIAKLSYFIVIFHISWIPSNKIADFIEFVMGNFVIMKRKGCEDVMDDLQDLEDLLDEFAAEALRREVVSEGSASSSKVHSFIPACFSGLSPSAVKFNISMGSKMSSITSQMEELSLGWKRLPEEEHQMLHGEEQTVHVCQQNLLFTGEMKIKPRYLIWC
ncbi:hypothetical protein Pint_27291 [Pistacia integerrima]|uniref:Uncharacterized protein n=1 Tax=Pistacia integerrima TaxID=434235 RepID=A0ACC0YSI0_9ROSI|nr:hypothetical protein Pint_27291 [Pistacia integerrima]